VSGSNPAGPPPATFSSPPVPEIIDLRGRLLPVGDQGRRGTCVAFAVTAAHEAHRTTTSGSVLEDLAEDLLYWACKQLDGVRGPGTRLSVVDSALQRWGQPPEQFWPYDQHRDEQDGTQFQPPSAALDPAHCHRGALRRVPADEDSIRVELQAGRPVVVGLRVWDGLRQPGSSPLPAPTVADLEPAGHAMVIVGWNRTERAVLLRNSWGSTWADAGHLWVSSDLIPLLTSAWVVDEPMTTSAQLLDLTDEILTEGS
jgi:hypothetical protein